MFIFSVNILDSEFFFFWVVLHDLYSSPNIILGEHLICVGEKRNTYTVLVGKRGVKRPLGRHTRGREDDIEVIVYGKAWFGLAD
jgi:hypothetical protein